MLNLALARTGVLIPANRIEILDKQLFAQTTDELMRRSSEVLSAGANADAQKLEEALHCEAYREEDGSMMMYYGTGDAPQRQVRLPKGTWRLLDDAEYRMISHELPAGGREDLIESLATAMRSGAEKISRGKAEAEEIGEGYAFIVVVTDRQPVALGMLRERVRAGRIQAAVVDEWLSGEAPFLLHTDGPLTTLRSAMSVINTAELERRLTEIRNRNLDVTRIALAPILAGSEARMAAP